MADQVDTNKGIWLRYAFLLPTDDSADSYGSQTKRRRATSAAFKFTNASLGGNYVVNTVPQFTRFCDVRQPGRGRTEANKDEGQGRYYSEAFDDTQEIIHMTFGVPKFSTWTAFFTNFYDVGASMLANTGTVGGAWYNLGNAGGYIVTLPLQPFIIGITGVSRLLSFLNRSQPSKWYYFKPTMHNYWSAVNTLANEFAVNLGIIPRFVQDGFTEVQDPGQRVTDADRATMHRMFPDLFREDGGIDVMALANRAQRISDASQKALNQQLEKVASIKELRNSIETFMANPANLKDPNPGADARKQFLDALNVEPVTEKSLGSTSSFTSWNDWSNTMEFVTASQRDGSQFVSFKVEHSGAQTESFSNTTKQSDIAQQLNSKVSMGRNAQFNFMAGGISGGIGELVSSLNQTIAGALDSVNLGGLQTLTGAAFIDIPEIWEASTATLPSADYKIVLPCVYGNVISRYLDIFVPLAMLLPTVMPLAAGRSAYTSPFLCQIYNQGHCQYQLAMVENLSITRGGGNVGWNADKDLLSCEVTMTIKSLSSLMTMPIKAGFASPSWAGTAVRAAAATAGEAIAGDTGAGIALAGVDGSVWDEQSLFSDYVATLTSMSVADLYYVGKRLNLNITKTLRSFKSWRSKSNFMSYVLDFDSARAISAFANTSDRFN